MNIAIVVGKGFRDLQSVRRFISRMKKGTSLVLLNPLSSAGDVVAFHAAERTGITVSFVTADDNTKIAKVQQRVEFVKSVDRIVVFDDGSNRTQHVINLASANDKELVRFKEV